MVFVQDIITGDKMGHYNHLSTIEREIILCGIPKRHLRHKGKPRRRKGNEEKRGKIPITNNIADRPKEANERVETITPDRGKEFAEHGAVTKHLGGKQFYFPLPHHPWQRGTNENTNGLLREYFSKRKDIKNYNDE